MRARHDDAPRVQSGRGRHRRTRRRGRADSVIRRTSARLYATVRRPCPKPTSSCRVSLSSTTCSAVCPAAGSPVEARCARRTVADGGRCSKTARRLCSRVCGQQHRHAILSCTVLYTPANKPRRKCRHRARMRRARARAWPEQPGNRAEPRAACTGSPNRLTSHADSVISILMTIRELRPAWRDPRPRSNAGPIPPPRPAIPSAEQQHNMSRHRPAQPRRFDAGPCRARVSVRVLGASPRLLRRPVVCLPTQARAAPWPMAGQTSLWRVRFCAAGGDRRTGAGATLDFAPPRGVLPRASVADERRCAAAPPAAHQRTPRHVRSVGLPI